MSHIGPSKLNRIHEAFAQVCLELLKGEPLVDANGTALLNEQGQPIFLRPKANILKEIREFLKDNGIDREPTEASGIPQIAAELPKYDDEPLLLEEE